LALPKSIAVPKNNKPKNAAKTLINQQLYFWLSRYKLYSRANGKGNLTVFGNQSVTKFVTLLEKGL